MTQIDLAALRLTAEAANFGHWKHVTSYDGAHSVLAGAAPGGPVGGAEWVTRGKVWRGQDAAYIAAAQPKTVLELIERLERAEDARALENHTDRRMAEQRKQP